MNELRITTPRLVVAGLSGDSGKTLLSLGLVRAFRSRGVRVQPLKKGPDYIDPAWLAAAGGRPCRNLDTFLMDDAALGFVLDGAGSADLLLMEGNRGLFDGFDAEGTHSTAALARRLSAPVVLSVDVTKTTRTVAALVLGCKRLDPELDLRGVILNQVATARQERIIRQAVERDAGVPVLGAVPRLRSDDPLPGRHLGLVTVAEHPAWSAAIDHIAEAVADSVDLDSLLEAAATAKPVVFPLAEAPVRGDCVRIGVFRDEVFSFYYPENTESLIARGAEIVPVSPMGDDRLPSLDGLYIGGGFPEEHAARLAERTEFAASVRRLVERGLPVYAECGGLMYLSRELIHDGVTYPMAGVLDVAVEQTDRPQGHGYVVGEVRQENPFFSAGTRLVGHEFHYSKLVADGTVRNAVVQLERGTGVGNRRDGIVRDRVWASYLHLHGAGTSGWADGFLDLARRHAAERSDSSVQCA